MPQKKDDKKTYQVDPERMSELSFIQLHRTAYHEMTAYWDKRLDMFMTGVRESFAIPPHWDVEWNEMYKNGTITAIKRDPPTVAAEAKDGETHGTPSTT